MAISINHATRVIYVPQNFLTQVSTTAYELDIDEFRLALKNLEDDADGIQLPDTHRHNAPVALAGLALAPVVEIINGYTVTFEDGNYFVNLVGANSNIADVVNLNQVSVRSFNSAGLVQLQAREIQATSFNTLGACVCINTVTGVAGTNYPTGTRSQMVNNLTDALIIASSRSIGILHVHGNLNILAGEDVSGFTIIGDHHQAAEITLEDGSITNETIFKNIHISGIFNAGAPNFINCFIYNANNFNGIATGCTLGGIIYIGGDTDVSFIQCYDGVNPGAVELDLGGTGRKVEVRDYYGGLKISNKTGTEEFTANFSAGRLAIANTVTNGSIVVRGVGEISSNLGTATLNTTGLVNSAMGADAVHDRVMEGALTFQQSMRLLMAVLFGKVSGAAGPTITFRDSGDTTDRVIATVDAVGNRTSVTTDPS